MTIEDFFLYSNDYFEYRLLGNGLYCLQTTAMNSGHDTSEFVRNYVFVDFKTYKFSHKIEGKKKFVEKMTLSLEVRLRQGWVPNVCLQ